MRQFSWLILLPCLALACLAGELAAQASPSAQPTQRAPAPSPTPSPARARCRVTTGQPGGLAFLRAGPGRNTRALGVASEGDLLTLIFDLTPTPPSGPAWLNVQAGELAGWIYADLCEVKP